MAEKAVVVGAGGISGAWFPPLLQEKVEVLAVVDLSIEAAQAKVAEYKLEAEASTDLHATLESTRPDFVLDLTTPESHCQVTCAALEAGCHVLGEKPMASTMAEARKMVRTSEQTGKLYMVSQTYRWNPLPDSVRRTVADGKIGDLTTLNCDFYLGAHFGGFREQMPSPLLLDMAIHHFDLARFLGQVDPVAVYAKEFNPKGSWFEGDVAASCIFEMTDGVIFTYRGSWCAEGFPTTWNGNWRIIGDRGSLLFEQDQQPRLQVVSGMGEFHSKLRDIRPAKSPVEHALMHGALREMLTFLRTGKQPQTECHDNIKSLAMVHAAIESSRTLHRVTVEVA